MSNDDIGIEGPRTLRYFANLLVIATMVYVLGHVLNVVHGVGWVEQIAAPFVENPTRLLNIAGFAAFIVVLVIGARFVSQYVE